MPKQNRTAKTPTNSKNQTKPPAAEQAGAGAALAEFAPGPLGVIDTPSIAGQASRLGNARLQTIQRQQLANRIGQLQGNGHLQQTLALARQHQQDQALYQSHTIHKNEASAVVQRRKQSEPHTTDEAVSNGESTELLAGSRELSAANSEITSEQSSEVTASATNNSAQAQDGLTGSEGQVMSQEIASAGGEQGVSVQSQPGQPTVLMPAALTEREIAVPSASQPTASAPTPAQEKIPQQSVDMDQARNTAIRGALPQDLAQGLKEGTPATNGTNGVPPGLGSEASPQPSPTVTDSLAESQTGAPSVVPPLLAADPTAFSAEIPQRELTAQEIFEEVQSGRTPEQSRAEATTLLSNLTAEAEQEKAALLAEIEARKAQIATQAEAQIGLIQPHAAAQTAQLEAHYTTLKSNLAGHAEQQKATLSSQFAQFSAQVTSDKDARISELQQQLEQRRNALSTHKAQQQAQLTAISGQEAARSDQELEAAASEALAIGEAKASQYPGEEDGAPEKRSAARELTRQSANDIRSHKGGIRSTLQEKASEFSGRYDQYVQAANEAISAAAPDIIAKLNESAQQTQNELQNQLTAAQQGIEDRLHIEQGVLDQALQQAVQQINVTSTQVIGQLREAAQQATTQLDHTGETLCGCIDNAVAQAETVVINAEEPYLPGVQDVISTSQEAVQQLSAEGRIQIATTADELAANLADMGQSFVNQISELTSSLQQNGNAALERANSAIDQTQQRAVDQAQPVIQQAQAQHQALLNEAMQQVDDAVNRAKTEMNAVTDQFRSEAHEATNDSINEAKKPLTDPLPDRVDAAVARTERGWFRGLLAALGEIIVGFLIVVAIALVVAAVFGLTLGGAMLIVGAVFLVIAFGAALYKRSQQNPNASLGKLVGVALADATGVTGIYEGIRNHDIMTGEYLNLDAYERTRRGTVGFVQLVGTVLLAVGGVRAAQTGGIVRPTGIGRGNYSLAENARAVWGDLAQMGRGAKGFFGRLYERIAGQGENGAPGEGPPASTPETSSTETPSTETPSTETPSTEPPRLELPEYDPKARTPNELATDTDPTPRAGETAEQAQARAKAAAEEIEIRKMMDTYEALGDEPRQIDLRAEDGHHQSNGAHTTGANGRHAADIPLERGPGKTIEGRIYGDPPWANRANASTRWFSDNIMNDTVNQHLRANWETIRSDLAQNGRYQGEFDVGNAVGEGYVNINMGGNGPPSAQYIVTSRVGIVLELIPGNPPSYYIVTTFPKYL